MEFLRGFRVTRKKKNTISQMRLRSAFKMQTGILNAATTEQMGYGIFSFFVYIKPANQTLSCFTGIFKFSEFLFCPWGQILRYLNLHCCILITIYRRILHGYNTFTTQSEFTSGLRSRLNIATNISINCLYGYITTEYGSNKWNRDA